MTGIPSYSTTAANNVNANTGIVWDEGMSPGLVNNSARQNMADTRAAFNDLHWFQYGVGDESVSCVYQSASSFTIAGANVTAIWNAHRRVKAVGSLTGTIYGSISSSSYSGSTNTVNVTWDNSANLSNESLTIYLSQTQVTGTPVAAESIATGTISGPITVNGSIAGTTLAGTHMTIGDGSTISAASTSNNYQIDSITNLTGIRLWLSWNSGDGFAECMVSSGGTVTAIGSSNALGSSNSFDTTNSFSSNSGLGIALVTGSGFVYIQTKSSGYTGTVKVARMTIS